MDNQLFRKKSIERISSPERLQDYMRVTSPAVWMVLSAVIVLLAGLLICSAVGKVETSYPVEAQVESGTASVSLVPGTKYTVEEGMVLRISEDDYSIDHVRRMEDQTTVVTAPASLPDGTYDARIVTESITPISFLLN